MRKQRPDAVQRHGEKVATNSIGRGARPDSNDTGPLTHSPPISKYLKHPSRSTSRFSSSAPNRLYSACARMLITDARPLRFQCQERSAGVSVDQSARSSGLRAGASPPSGVHAEPPSASVRWTASHRPTVMPPPVSGWRMFMASPTTMTPRACCDCPACWVGGTSWACCADVALGHLFGDALAQLFGQLGDDVFVDMLLQLALGDGRQLLASDVDEDARAARADLVEKDGPALGEDDVAVVRSRQRSILELEADKVGANGGLGWSCRGCV